MSESQFNALVQMIASLSDRVEVLAKNQKKFATKADLKDFATKADLKKFATKDDLKRFATKEDLKKFATKNDLKEYSGLILEAIEAPFSDLNLRLQHVEQQIARRQPAN